MSSKTLTLSPADLLKYRNDLVRTGKFLPIGRMRTIALGPCASYSPPANDPIIRIRGRMIDLSGQYLPIGQVATDDGSLVLCTSTLTNRDGYVGLPDLVDPTWRAADFTEEEAMNPDCDVDCRKQTDIKDGKRVPHVHIRLRAGKDKPRLIPQRLEDRTNDRLEGTNFLVFQPVLRITYQPEKLKAGEHTFEPAEWKIEFRPDSSGTHCAFLADPKTGECHFFGGLPIFGGDSRG
jgi:hypothetical protein